MKRLILCLVGVLALCGFSRDSQEELPEPVDMRTYDITLLAQDYSISAQGKLEMWIEKSKPPELVAALDFGGTLGDCHSSSGKVDESRNTGNRMETGRSF